MINNTLEFTLPSTNDTENDVLTILAYENTTITLPSYMTYYPSNKSFSVNSSDFASVG